MKTAVFVTARTDSSRLKDKMLAKILDIPIISHNILRASQVKADEVILCTTNRKEDDVLAKITNTKVFRGDLNRIKRWDEACQKFGIDAFVNFDGDDLFTSIELMNLSLSMLKEVDSIEYIGINDRIVCGAFTYAFRAEEIKRIAKNYLPYYIHEWQLFKNFCNFTNIIDQTNSVYYGDERLTLDYGEDFLFFDRVFGKIKNCNITPLCEILNFLRQNPDLIEINKFRQKDFLRGQGRG
jgi:spore coat polysaccharide biosynthesis protein SpsF